MRALLPGLGCLMLILGFNGCQSVKVSQRDSAPHASFMETWRVYHHCMSTEDLESLMVDTLLLKQAVGRMQQDEVLRLFSPIQSLMSPAPVRLSADPRAMTASCILRAADTALGKGWKDLAATLYESIMKDYSGPSYAYYRQQAGDGLTHILQHMANLPDTAASVAQDTTHP
jgi:hypothetical protein